MKFCSNCKESKSLDLFGKDKYSKDGKLARCKACKKLGNKRYYNDCNKIERAKMNSDIYSNNKEEILERNKKWKLKNKDKTREYSAQRRTILEQAVVSWRNQDKINNIYKQAKELEDRDGIKRHVDHIVPLNGKEVSGLHVENNLQILTAEENLKKSNSFQI
jgi:hypothetical protein